MQIDRFTSQNPDYSSMEIRWFFPENIPELKHFVQRNFNVKPEPEIRTDTYYPIIDRKDLGFKIREGSQEIKKRRKPGVPFSFQRHLAGYLEYWDKWILNSPLPDLHGTVPCPIRKKRWVLKFNSQSEEDYTAFPYEEKLAQGIQVEYAELKKGRDTSYTFCLEVFGDTTPSHLEKITDILPVKGYLHLENSYAYPAWILRQYRI
ncbi:hypothetical protein [Cyclobacterium roseum]|uniref:hypothetical protein n=1 Tax=Cyclobacterium roseum TaxID=2666137 RepID=UPI001391F249|nr:hypothetical protein [Cyclobacterium roseum]